MLHCAAEWTLKLLMLIIWLNLDTVIYCMFLCLSSIRSLRNFSQWTISYLWILLKILSSLQSLWWFFFSSTKKIITLNLLTPLERKWIFIFCRLWRRNSVETLLISEEKEWIWSLLLSCRTSCSWRPNTLWLHWSWETQPLVQLYWL